jgi:hypothetical protein
MMQDPIPPRCPTCSKPFADGDRLVRVWRWKSGEANGMDFVHLDCAVHGPKGGSSQLPPKLGRPASPRP